LEFKTIIVLYDDKTGDYYVGVVDKILIKEEKAQLALKHNAAIDGSPDSHDPDRRTISFRIVKEGDDLVNIWD